MLTITQTLFLGTWLQHYNEFSPAYMDGVFLFLYFCYLASEHCSGPFPFWIILMSERISWEATHCDNLPFFKEDYQHKRPHGPFRFAGVSFFPAGLHLTGNTDMGLRARHLYFFTLRAASLAALARCLPFFAFVRLEICTFLGIAPNFLLDKSRGDFKAGAW